MTTDVPTTLRVELRGRGVDLDLAFPEVSRTHVVSLHGTRPDRDIEVTVELDAALGGRRRVTTSFRTGALPRDVPQVQVLARRGPVTAGWILLPLQSLAEDGHGWLVAIDPRDGEVVWAYDGGWDFNVVGVTEALTLLGMPNNQTVVELDLFAVIFRRWSPVDDPFPGADDAVPIDARWLNHDVRVDGDRLTLLATRSTEVPAYPTSYEDPGTLGGNAWLADGELASFDADDGTTLARWPLSERLDTTRIGFGSLERISAGRDWVHANAFLPYAGGWLVESRHQDALVSLDADGDVRSILSNPLGWGDAFDGDRLEGPADPPIHPHGPSFDRDGNLLLMDNRTEGGTPYMAPVDGPPRSRVIALAIDEDARTATNLWEWRPPDDLYSVGLGNAAALPNGDVIAAFPLLPSSAGFAIRVFQFTPGTAAPALDLFIRRAPSDPTGIRMYRALPLASFWPDDVEVTRR